MSTRKRLDSFAPSSTIGDSVAEDIHFKGLPCCRFDWKKLVKRLRPPTAIDPLGKCRQIIAVRFFLGDISAPGSAMGDKLGPPTAIDPLGKCRQIIAVRFLFVIFLPLAMRWEMAQMRTSTSRGSHAET